MSMQRLAIASLLSTLSVGTAVADIAPPYPQFDTGVQMDDGEPYPTLTNIFKGSPAEKAGLKKGDKVIALDRTYANSGMPGYFFAKGLKGPKGSKLTFIILRDGREVLVITAVRNKY